MKQYLLSLLIFNVAFMATSSVAIGQNNQHKVNGTVTDAKSGNPLPGVNISVKGTTIGTSTDAEGAYQLAVPSAKDTLVFSFIGYKTQEIPINGRSKLSVEMEAKALIGDELIVTGYQTQKKADLTGAVSVVDEEKLQDATSRNPIKALQGRIPGVLVSTTGSPNSGASVVIRGYSTLGNNEPLYIIDGIPTKSDIAMDLNPNNIESMQVLKSASAASIYGARASNGVIIITTKNGSEGEFSVNYRGQLTTQSYVTKLDPLNTKERGRVLWEAAINDGISPDNALYDYESHTESNGNAVLDRVIVPEWLSKERGIRTANTNWYDEISRMGVIQSHNLSVSTGNKRGSAMLGLRYYNNKGIVKETDYNQLQARINSQYNFFDEQLRLGENLTLSKGRETPMPSGLGGTPLWLALISQPILPVHTVDGGWAGPVGSGFDDRDNPVRLLEHNRWDKNNTFRVFGNVFADLDIIENLTLSTRFGIDYSEFYSRNIQRTYQSGFLNREINSLTTIQNHLINWTWSNTLNYQRDFDKHHAELLAGMELVDNTFEEFSTYRDEFAIETPDYFYNNAGTGIKNNSGSRSGYSLMSYFGKVNYNYADKYLASATLRYDGSSRFGSKNKFGFFPAFSLGWRLNKEPFFRENISFISDFKIRFGWGRTGNQEIANNAIYSLYAANYGDDPTWGPSNGTAYDLNGSDTGNLPSGFLRTQAGNNRLRWESTTETDIGLDFGLFEQKLTGTVDYFFRKTEDILIFPGYLGTIGYGGGQWVNGASVENKGFEFSITYNHDAGNINYSITGNLGAFRDKITKLPPEVIDSYAGNSEKTILGHSQNALFGYVAEGLFDTQEEVENHAQQPGKGLGRIRYKDLDSDGAITPLDQKFIGVESPNFQYGINTNVSYKNFTLNLFLQGVQGIEVYNDRKIYTDFTSIWNGANYGSRTLNAWTPVNKDSPIPALTRSDDNDEDRPSTYFVEDGSYLKVRSLQIGYTFGRDIISQLKMDGLRLYVRGENLFTLKDTKGSDQFTGPDPENPHNLYPRPLKLTFGIDLSF